MRTSCIALFGALVGLTIFAGFADHGLAQTTGQASPLPHLPLSSTALLVIDPYNDFLSEGGKLWERTKETAVTPTT